MLFSYKWLKEFVAIDVPATEVADALTMAGVEVEEVIDADGGVSGVVTGEVLSVDAHPNADKLKVCSVSTGEAAHSIVCGASNMKPGDKVALALPGARLPGGLKIKKSKIRGERSEGMLCSEVELGVAESAEGIMILDSGTPLGEDFVEYSGMGDTLMEVAILPNRADIMSTRGLAREIGAVTGAEFVDQRADLNESGGDVSAALSVTIEAPDLCPRYAARVVTGATPSPSPKWLSSRIEALGVRSVNNIVDATNYVMLELGQPLHAFDLDLLAGGELWVRGAVKGEKIETIDNVTRELEEGMLVIADAASPQAVAGIMGGAASAVHDGTKNIAIESAWFDPASVRTTSRRLGLTSDSSYRFERGVDINMVERALDRAASLIAELTGGKVMSGVAASYPTSQEAPVVPFSIGRASKVLGIELDRDDVKDAFTRLGFGWKESTGDVLDVTPPSYRRDVTIPEDLMEEVARLVGYDKVPVLLPPATHGPKPPSAAFSMRSRVREILSGAGMVEAINYSFVSEKSFGAAGAEKNAVRLRNPISDDQSVMRQSLLPGLMENLALNLSRNNEGVRLFEVGPVYRNGRSGGRGGSNDGLSTITESWRVGGVLHGQRFATGWDTPGDPLDFYDLKGLVEGLIDSLGGGRVKVVPNYNEPFFHPGKCAAMMVGKASAGGIGEVHPDVADSFDVEGTTFAFELDLAVLQPLCLSHGDFKRPPRFPASARDVAFFVDEAVPYGEIVETLRGVDRKNIENVLLFDVYYGENNRTGKRSLAVRLIYRSGEKTLKTSDVERIHGRVCETLTSRFGAELRV